VLTSETVLGRWRDANDVNFVRLYALRATGDTAPPPAWMRGDADGPAPRGAAAALDALRASLIQVVTAQESYYADHARYAAFADLLTWEVPEGIVLDVLAGDTRGWIGVATAAGLPYLCAMAVGSSTPAGWPEGSARCSGPEPVAH
jgi:hypothetical protein